MTTPHDLIDQPRARSHLRQPHEPSPRTTMRRHPYMRLMLGVAILASLGGCFLSGDTKRRSREGATIERDEAAVTEQDCAAVDPNAGVPDSLPPSPTVSAGKIADRFQVSSNGAAVYTLPIVVPPGRAGIEPSLALTYSSDAPNGIAGVGFGLQGLSIITRCPLNVAEDGRYREVSYDADDRFCLDGQRLVAVKGGVYGANGTEYRTRPDTFAKVVSHTTANETGPYQFTVFTKDGRILTYGDADDPFHGAAGASNASVLGTNSVRAWALRRVEDRSDNFMTVSYLNESSGAGGGYTVEQIPYEIRYTGHGSTEPTRVVSFSYGVRPDPWSGYSKGMRLASTMRLEGITTSVGVATARSYRLFYDTSVASGRSRVTRVEECGADDVCKPPTVFRWKDIDAEGGFYGKMGPSPAQPLPDPPQANATYASLDINGDGLDDIAVPVTENIGGPTQRIIWIGALASARGANFGRPYVALDEEVPSTQPARNVQATPIDYNQDGRDDLLLHDTNSPLWRVLLSQNTDDSSTSSPFHSEAIPDIPSAIANGGTFHLADMTGDGVPDLIQCRNEPVGGTSHLVWRLYVHGGSGFSSSSEIIDKLTNVDLNEQSAPCEQKIISFDVDGDGALELLVKQTKDVISLENYKIVSRKTTSAGAQWVVADSSLPLKAKTVFPMDVNGDGLKDVVVLGQVSEVPEVPDDARIRTYLNTGAGFGPEQLLFGDGYLSEYNPAFDALALVVDANNDGREDLLVPHELYNQGRTWHLLLSEGESFRHVDSGIVFEYRTDAGTPDSPNWYAEEPWRFQGPRPNRSGGIYAISGGHFVEYASAARDADVIDGIMDGLSFEGDYETFPTPSATNVTVAYGALESQGPLSSDTSEKTYLKGDLGCSYPVSCVASAKRVVAAYFMPKSGNEEGKAHVMHYRDARYDRLARRWLGFGQVLHHDTYAGTYALTNYDNVSVLPSVGQRIYAHLGEVRSADTYYDSRTGGGGDVCSLRGFDNFRSEKILHDGATFFSTSAGTNEVEYEFSCVEPDLRARRLLYWSRSIATVGNFFRQSWTDSPEYDAYGNVTHQEASVYLPESSGRPTVQTIDRTYESPDESNWLVARLSSEKTCGDTPLDDTTQEKKCRETRMTTSPVTGLPATVTVGAHDPGRALQTTFTYDIFGNVIATSAQDLGTGEVRSACKRYDVDAVYPIVSMNALGHATRSRWDALSGAPLTLVDANGLVTQRSYDGFGRLAFELAPGGRITSQAMKRELTPYPDAPAVSRWVTSLQTQTLGGADTTVEYDRLGRAEVVSSSGFGGLVAVQRLAYSGLHDGLVAKRSLVAAADTPLDQLTYDIFTHDAQRRPRVQEEADGRISSIAYDKITTYATDRRGIVTERHYDARGLLARVVDPPSSSGVVTSTSYQYDPFGALVQATVAGTDGTSAQTRFVRDAFGRAVLTVDPDRGITTRDYNAFGELTITIDALGRIFRYEYDALGRVRFQRSYTPDGTTMRSQIEYAYDVGEGKAIGRPTRLAFNDLEHGASHRIVYRYDQLGRLAKLDNLAPKPDGTGEERIRVQYGYDGVSRLESVTYPEVPGAAPLTLIYKYDDYGHIVAISEAGAATSLWALDAADAAGRIRFEHYGNGVGTLRTYPDAQNPVSALVSGSPANSVQDLRYAYNENRTLRQRIDNLQGGVVEEFVYDNLERLSESHIDGSLRGGFFYDGIGNMSLNLQVGAMSYDPARPHVLVSTDANWLPPLPPNPQFYGHDAIGRQTQRPDGVAIVYNDLDQPAELVQTQNGLSLATFAYDGRGHRVRKTTDAEDVTYAAGLFERHQRSDGSVEYTLRVLGPAATITDGLARPVAELVYKAPTASAPPVRSTRYVHPDPLGSPDVLTDEAGQVLERRSYAPFGAARNAEWRSVEAPGPEGTNLGFTGHEDDRELGLVNMGGRVYDPKLARFLQPDALVQAPGFSLSWNPYSYVFHSPLRYTDPSGFAAEPAPPSEEPIVVCATPPCAPMPTPTPTPTDPTVIGPWANGVETTGPAPQGAQPQAAPAAPPAQPAWSLSLSPGGSPAAALGFAVGVVSGLVPGGALANALGMAAVPPNDAGYEFGNGLGQIVGGLLAVGGGTLGELGGVTLSATGIGAAVGVPAVVAGAVAQANGATAIVAGAAQVLNALNSHHSFSTAKGPGGSPQSTPSSAPGSSGLRIVDQEGNIVEMTGTVQGHEIRVMGNMTREGDTLFLRQAHIQGPGPGKVGVKSLFDAVRGFGRDQGVRRVVIEGAKRSTGAGNQRGAVPRPWTIEVD